MELKIGAQSESVQGTVTWRHSTARSFGSLTAFVPRSSPLFGLIDPEGNQSVETYQDGLFFWYGVTDTPIFDRRGAQVTAQEQSAYSQYRMVSRERTLRNLTAGAIVRQGFADAMAGIGGWKAGVFLESGPTIGDYTFSGQTFANVLSDMMDRTGQEWVLGPDMDFSWIAPTGNLYSVHLTESGDALQVQQIGVPEQPVSQVVAVGSDGRVQTAQAGILFGGYWQREVAVQINSTSAAELGLAARAELQSRRNPPVQYRLRLRREHWAIREGDFVQLIVPSMSNGHQCPAARVIERSYQAGDPFVSLILAFMPNYRSSDLGVLGSVPLVGAATALTVPRRVLRLERRPIAEQQRATATGETVTRIIQRIAADGGNCMPDGTVQLPGWPFCKEHALGFYRPAANQLAVAGHGEQLAVFDSQIITGGTKSNIGTLIRASEPIQSPPGQYIPYPVLRVRGRDTGNGYFELQTNFPNFNNEQWGVVQLAPFAQRPPGYTGQTPYPGLQLLASNIFNDLRYLDSGVGAASGAGYYFIPSKNGAWVNAPGPDTATQNRAALGWDRANKRLYVCDNASGIWVWVNLSGTGGVPTLALDDLTDVVITSPAVKQVPRYNGSSWVNALLLFDDLSDVVISSPATGQVPRYNGSNFVNAALSASDLSDVEVTSPANGQVLAYNSTNTRFENASAASASNLDSLTDVAISSPTNNQVLAYESASSLWKNKDDPGGGGGGALTQLAQTVLGSAAASINFSSISGSYSALRILMQARGDTSAPAIDTRIQFNGDTAANYDHRYLQGTGTAAATGGVVAAASGYLGNIPANTAPASVPAQLDILIVNYAGTTFHKTVVNTVGHRIGTLAGNVENFLMFSDWRSTSAITSILLFPASGNFVAGTVATLYGLT